MVMVIPSSWFQLVHFAFRIRVYWILLDFTAKLVLGDYLHLGYLLLYCYCIVTLFCSSAHSA